MRINHNIAALNTYRQLTSNTSSTSKSLEKLSSGLRINRAGDDAAGLAISEKMRSQIRGLDTASRNANDGISLIQTAEGALNETHSILQRMKELSVQAANDTNTTADRAEIQKEINELTKEIDRIAKDTEFNTKKLLDGSAGLKTTMTSETVGGANVDWMTIIGGTGDTQTGDVSITAGTAATGATTTLTVGAGTAGAQSVTINGTTINFEGSTTAATNAANLRAALESAAEELGITVGGSDTSLALTTKATGSSASLKVAAGANVLGTDPVSADKLGSDASLTINGINSDQMVSGGNTVKVVSGNYAGLEIKVNGDVMHSTAANNQAEFTIDANNSLTLHIGANAGQNMVLSVNNMGAETLGINSLDLTTQETADAAITTIDSAISIVSSERAKLGAVQNRLEHTINNLGTTSENLTASESRIRDVDMAKEMMEFTKNNILSQAAQAMLAQANQQPQSVLQLSQ